MRGQSRLWKTTWRRITRWSSLSLSESLLLLRKFYMADHFLILHVRQISLTPAIGTYSKDLLSMNGQIVCKYCCPLNLASRLKDGYCISRSDQVLGFHSLDLSMLHLATHNDAFAGLLPIWGWGQIKQRPLRRIKAGHKEMAWRKQVTLDLMACLKRYHWKTVFLWLIGNDWRAFMSLLSASVPFLLFDTFVCNSLHSCNLMQITEMDYPSSKRWSLGIERCDVNWCTVNVQISWEEPFISIMMNDLQTWMATIGQRCYRYLCKAPELFDTASCILCPHQHIYDAFHRCTVHAGSWISIQHTTVYLTIQAQSLAVLPFSFA